MVKNFIIKSDHKNCVYSIAISKNNKFFASSAYDGKINIYDLQTNILIQTLETHTDIVGKIRFTEDS